MAVTTAIIAHPSRRLVIEDHHVEVVSLIVKSPRQELILIITLRADVAEQLHRTSFVALDIDEGDRSEADFARHRGKRALVFVIREITSAKNFGRHSACLQSLILETIITQACFNVKRYNYKSINDL